MLWRPGVYASENRVEGASGRLRRGRLARLGYRQRFNKCLLETRETVVALDILDVKNFVLAAEPFVHLFDGAGLEALDRKKL